MTTAVAVGGTCRCGIRASGSILTVLVMIEVQALTKRYGSTLAVDDLSFTVRPGCVTGFLGPNGSGKSTTMRLVLGLDAPTSGWARIGGRSYRSLRAPLREVGALIDARGTHPGRTAAHHLLGLARSNRIAASRVDEVLSAVGLVEAGDRRTGEFSLGMGQRLGIASALLGNPATILLDEPFNGLDTEGIRWIRSLMRRLADEGRTVLVSSHLMSEMERSADRLVVIGRGRLLADTTVASFIDASSAPVVSVRTPHPEQLRRAIERVGATVAPEPSGAWLITGLDAAAIGDLALDRGIGLHELTPIRSSLEDSYTLLTQADTVHRSGAGAGR